MYGQFYKSGDVVDYTAGAAISGGTLVAVAGGVGLVQSDMANGDTQGVLVKGQVKYAKLSTDDVSAGNTLYLDTGNNRLTKIAGSLSPAGKAVYASAAGATTVICALNEFSNAVLIAT